MRKTILLASAAALGLGFASSSAFADVNLLVNVTKTKDVDITETISVTKVANIILDVNVEAAKAAEASTILNQSNHGNLACENCAEKLDQILGSVNGNSGVASVNQAAGNNNNQGSVLTAAIDVGFPAPPEDPPPPPPPGVPAIGGFAHAQGHIDQKNGVVLGAEGECVSAPNTVQSVEIIFRQAEITDSIIGNQGLTMVNQATGQMNNQGNAVTIAVSLAAGGVALSEADLGQETSNNVTSESDVVKTTLVNNSVNNNTGVTLVNQAAGNMSNQANNLSLGAAVFVSNL